MAVAEYWKSLTSGQKQGLAAALGRGGLRLLGGLCWLGVHANLAVYRCGLLRQARIDRPVLAVGNLTLGGTGKTTATVYLVRELADAGLKAGVLLRGHGRRRGPRCLLVSDGEHLHVSAPEAGDEALVLAALLPGHPIGVGIRREQVAQLLLSRAEVGAFVLDDAFQYFRLVRDADIVLVDASHHIEHDRLFPAGTLREPHDHLRRASQIWITHAELVPAERTAQLKSWLTQVAPGKPIVLTRHRPAGMRSLAGSEPPPSGGRVIALSGLGNPRSFEAGLEGLGYEVVPLRLPDHHVYKAEDWKRVQRAVEESRAQAVVTTEKDAVKLPAPPPSVGPVHVMRCEMEIVEGHRHVEALIEGLASCRGR